MPVPARGARGGALAGRTVVVTRPADQAEGLARSIEAAGGRALRFPVLAIGAAADPAPLARMAERIEAFDFAVFVSPNAIERALAVILARRAWPAKVRALAMGPGSAAELARRGVSEVLVPEAGSDSEALLRRPELQAARIAGRRVAIFRGESGRELLGETLAARGAQVEFIACYRRQRPPQDAGPLRAALERGDIDAIVVTSSEGLRNLVAMVGEAGAAALRRAALIAPHERIAGQARSMGFARVVATGVGDAAVLAGLADFFRGGNGT